MYNIIARILKEYKIKEGVYSPEATAAVIESLEDNNINFLFTEIDKDDMSGGTVVISYIDDGSLYMKEWEYERRI